MYRKFVFNKHVECMIAKAYSMLGFIKKRCENFQNIGHQIFFTLIVLCIDFQK